MNTETVTLSGTVASAETHAIAKGKKAAAPKAKKAKPAAPAKAKKAPKPDPVVAKLEADLARSKKRLSKKAAPAKKAPAKKKAQSKAKKTGTYATLAAQHTGASTVEHPVQAMWNLCDKMQTARRKDVIAAAVEMGVSYYTARTQYQLWLSAFRNS